VRGSEGADPGPNRPGQGLAWRLRAGRRGLCAKGEGHRCDGELVGVAGRERQRRPDAEELLNAAGSR